MTFSWNNSYAKNYKWKKIHKRGYIFNNFVKGKTVTILSYKYIIDTFLGII